MPPSTDVIQGTLDTAVPPINAVELVRQYLALNGHAAAKADRLAALPQPDHVGKTTEGGRVVTISDWTNGTSVIVRHVLVEGLGHAWSGGDEQYAYNDAHGPDATALLGGFVRSAPH